MPGGTGVRRVDLQEVDMDKDNIEIVKDLYEAFKRGDLPYIMERFSERFGETGASGVVADAGKRAPWHFALTSKRDLARYFESLLGTMEPLRLEARELAA